MTPDPESPIEKEVATLRAEVAALRTQIATLREELEDLRASAMRWITLYEGAIRAAQNGGKKPQE
jgi:predicted  nucleic acid-binding Zn-ribbon protein